MVNSVKIMSATYRYTIPERLTINVVKLTSAVAFKASPNLSNKDLRPLQKVIWNVDNSGWALA